MNLSPEEKKIGKENFHTAMGSTRRDFLKGTVLAGAATGVGLGAMYYGYGAKLEDPLRVGIIGTGDEGCVLIGALNPEFVDVVAIADIRPYNIHRAFHGDYNSPNALNARPGLLSVYNYANEAEARKHIKVYEDRYDELLADDNVEAVIIALPLWLHDIAAIKAMRAGKHVLTEKLMARTVAQCKEMARVADETDMILATGHQRHYSILYENAVDQIRRGLIGDIHHIRAQWHRGNMPGSDSWSPPMPVPMIPENEYNDMRRSARAKGLEDELRHEYQLLEQYYSLQKKARDEKYSTSEQDWFAAQALQKEAQLADYHIDAKKYGYQDKVLDNGDGYKRSALEELIRWRLWDRTGAGLMAELGSHQLDAASIFISSQRDDGNKVLPLSVVGSGHRSLFPPNREVDDHVYTTFEFPAQGYYKDINDPSKGIDNPNKIIAVTYSSINGNGFGGYGEVVFGTKGTMILEREKDVMLFKGSNTATNIQVSSGKSGPVLDTTESGGGQAAAVAEASIPEEVSRGYREEIEHWAWCIRNRSPENKPKCHPQVALADAVIALTSNIAMAEKRRIEFDPEWFEIDSDKTPEGDAPRALTDLA